MVDEVLFSHKVTEWVTPPELYNKLNDMFDFDLDPCTTEHNPLNTPHFYTKKENGLTKQWYGNVFVNPPYDQIEEWLAKAQKELETGMAPKIVFLLPARTDTKWFHTFIYDYSFYKFRSHVKVWFLKGRLKFRHAKNSAPFPSMVVIFSKQHQQ